MYYSIDARHEQFWQVGIARNAVSFHTFVASTARKVSSEKRGGAEDRLPKMSTQFAPRLRVRAIGNSKSPKIEGFGTCFEVELHKNCTTPARAKSLRLQGFGTLFEIEFRKICSTPARENGFCEKTSRCMFETILQNQLC